MDNRFYSLVILACDLVRNAALIGKNANYEKEVEEDTLPFLDDGLAAISKATQVLQEITFVQNRKYEKRHKL